MLTNYLLHFLKIATKAHKGCENEINNNQSSFLLEGWSIGGHITKVVEWIGVDFGLLILHKQRY